MHFFRALWANDLKRSGFTVVNEEWDKLDYAKFVIQGDSLRKFLAYPEKLGVYYYSKFPTSFIILQKEKIFFEKDGYVEPMGIVWDGQMARQRVGDLLPYEYNNK
jgi:hypothetical protein